MRPQRNSQSRLATAPLAGTHRPQIPPPARLPAGAYSRASICFGLRAGARNLTRARIRGPGTGNATLNARTNAGKLRLTRKITPENQGRRTARERRMAPPSSTTPSGSSICEQRPAIVRREEGLVEGARRVILALFNATTPRGLSFSSPHESRFVPPACCGGTQMEKRTLMIRGL
jgi:hypothetical protein